MSKSTISTFQLFEMFPDQETARTYLESRLWPEGPKCPVCGLGERITARAGGFYRCNQCKEDFSDERQQYRPGLQEMQRHRIYRYPVTQWKICAAGSGPG